MILFEQVPPLITKALGYSEVYLFDTVGITIVVVACLVVGCIIGLMLGSD